MELPNALRWAILYRLLTAGALIAGVALVIGGFVLGFGGAIELLLEEPLNPGPALEQANPMLTIALSVVGFIVWQIGKTFALFMTLPRAAGRSAARRFDKKDLKSDILEGLDGRLAQMEEDIVETKRSVHELKREQHAASFDEQTHLNADAADSDGVDAETGPDVPAALESGSPPQQESYDSETDTTMDREPWDDDYRDPRPDS